jgi:hypothetical protein
MAGLVGSSRAVQTKTLTPKVSREETPKVRRKGSSGARKISRGEEEGARKISRCSVYIVDPAIDMAKIRVIDRVSSYI